MTEAERQRELLRTELQSKLVAIRSSKDRIDRLERNIKEQRRLKRETMNTARLELFRYQAVIDDDLKAIKEKRELIASSEAESEELMQKILAQRIPSGIVKNLDGSFSVWEKEKDGSV